MDRRRPRVPSSSRPRAEGPEEVHGDSWTRADPDATIGDVASPNAADAADAAAREPGEEGEEGAEGVTEEIAADRRRSLRPVADAEDAVETTAGGEAAGDAGDRPATSGPAWREQRRRRRRERVLGFWRFVEVGNTHSTFWMLLGSSLALTAVGLIMVLSSSAVETLGSSGGAYGLFLRQAIWAGVGLVGLFAAMLAPRRWLDRLAWPALLLALVLLALVLTPLGYGVNGNRNWLRLGPITGQPAELAKLAMAVWSGSVLARKGDLVRHVQHALVPVVLPGGLLVLALVMAGKDLGTALVFGALIAAVLFTAGTRMRWFVISGALGISAAVGLTLVSVTRMQRVQVWLGMEGACEGVRDPCFQPMHGIYALASGGWWGVGLGQSRQKWNYLPEAENDFIFTILGEELGLLGALTVLALFTMLVLGMFRVASRSRSPFVRITTVGIMAWIIGQTVINLAMVTGLLPVIGIPLPFISYGGSALTATLLAVGVVLNFAREQRREVRLEETAPAADPGRGGAADGPDARSGPRDSTVDPAPGTRRGASRGRTSLTPRITTDPTTRKQDPTA
ncbi:hypothetical protein GCM10027060_01720 [Nesterenkonia halophila]